MRKSDSHTLLSTKLGRHFLLMLIAVSLIPAVMLGLIAFFEGRRLIISESEEITVVAVKGAESQVREFIERMKTRAVSLGVQPIVQEAFKDSAEKPKGNFKAISDYLAYMARISPTALEIFLTTPDGIVTVSSLPSRVGTIVRDQDCFSKGLRSVCVEDLHSPDGNPQWLIAAPISPLANSNIVGFIGIRMDSRKMSDLTSGRRVQRFGSVSQSVRIGQSGETYIVDRHGVMITESRFATNGSMPKISTAPIRSAVEKSNLFSGIYPDYRGIPVIGASVLIPELGWTIVSEIDLNEALSPVRYFRNILLATFGVVAVLFVLISVLFTRAIIRPIHAFRRAETALAEGDERSVFVADSEIPNNELGDVLRKRNERLRNLQETRGELEKLSYSIVHDMRAPLRTIAGFSRVLIEDHAKQLDPEGRDLLLRMMSAADRQDRLIQDVLAYHGYVRNQFPLAPVDLDQVISDILMTYSEFQPPKADIKVRRPLGRVLAHETLITQCISALLNNACKFVAPGVRPKIRIWTEKIPNQVKLWIEDNGIGIAAEHQERIFDIFQTLHRANVYPGTGIGLPLTKKAVERMNGTIGVESRVGAGSRFWIALQEMH